EDDPGHAIWKRDFRPGGCLFSLILKKAPEGAYSALFASLNKFLIGASWGGVHSLAAFYPANLQVDRQFSRTNEPIIRLSIGLEPVCELINDLAAALTEFQRHGSERASA